MAFSGTGTSSSQLSRSSGFGYSGSVHAHATAAVSGLHVISVTADTTNSISGMTTVTAETLIGTALPAFIASGQGVAVIDGAPTGPAVGPGIFGLGELGGAYSQGGIGSQTATSTFDIQLAVNKTDLTQDLVIGFTNGTSLTGSGVTGITLDIKVNGKEDTLLPPQTFNNVADAVKYFNGHTVDLGSIAGLAGSGKTLDVQASLTVTSHSANSGFFGGISLAG